MEKHSEYVNIGDRRIRNIKVVENHEPFIDLTQDNRIIVDTSKKQIYNGNHYFSYVRKGMHRKLIEARNYLPNHISFFIKEGYRSPKLQKGFFEYYYPIFRNKVKDLPEELLQPTLMQQILVLKLKIIEQFFKTPWQGSVWLTISQNGGIGLTGINIGHIV